MNREELEYLKKTDPIHYYEMTSNPTGVDGDGCLMEFVLPIIVIGLIVFIFFIISSLK